MLVAMRVPRNALVALVARFAARLRFPWLFGITAALLVIDLLVPDAVPFADELVLALGTLLLGSLRRRGSGEGDDESGPESPEDSAR
jgi:hypothetical protein